MCMHVSHNKILGVYMFGKKAAHTGMTSCQCCSGLTCVLMLIVCVQIEGLGRLWAQTHMHVCVCMYGPLNTVCVYMLGKQHIPA